MWLLALLACLVAVGIEESVEYVKTIQWCQSQWGSSDR